MNLLFVVLINIFHIALVSAVLDSFEIQFIFYPAENSTEKFILKTNQLLQESSRGYNWSLPTVFIIHGYTSNADDERFLLIKDRLNNHTQSNVIMIDWRGGADDTRGFIESYAKAAANTLTVGKTIADFIRNNKLKPENVMCIGHSLGAHVCGFAGKNTQKLGRITGIDPAGPIFYEAAKSARLDANDAILVDCIFTTVYFGIQMPICRLNFYPNRHFRQPQCHPLNMACAHSAGIYYYAYSIPDNKKPSCMFKAVRCFDARDDPDNCPKSCNKTSSCIQMGYEASKYSAARGSFYLQTQKEPPFCLN